MTTSHSRSNTASTDGSTDGEVSKLDVSTAHALETKARKRFGFGNNWAQFLRILDESRIKAAERSLSSMLGVKTLAGKRFLDIGSGSGLFSLAAHRLGASVHSFDYDPQSFACTQELHERFGTGQAPWKVEHASVLDSNYMNTLGNWDIVYSWGVLHHTGQMWPALEQAAQRVNSDGLLFIAIYNDQGHASRMWLRVKQLYNALPSALRWLVLGPALVRLWGPTSARDILRGRPFQSWRSYAENGLRGMSPWRDVVDWVGGLPFEVATPEEIFRFHRDHGFELLELRTCAGGLGCNEFVFRRKPR